MSTTISAVSLSQPYPCDIALVSIKPSWGDEWELDPSLMLLTASLASSGHGLGRARIARRYGEIKRTFESGFSSQGAYDLAGWWVRVDLYSGAGGASSLAWVGKVIGTEAKLHGEALGGAGEQEWEAVEVRDELRRSSVTRSHWLRGAEEVELGFAPVFNERDEDGRVVGNRSAALGSQEVYLFGGSDLWTRRHAIDYLLKYFGPSFPSFFVSGQTSLLESATDTVDLGDVSTLEEALAKLMGPSLGMDYVGELSEDSVALRVFSLLPTGVSFTGVELPGNPNTVTIDAGSAQDASVMVSEATGQMYDRVRLVGNRIVVCCSPALEGKWSASIETEYLNGAGLSGTTASDKRKNDKARQADRFDAVYQRFAAPSSWDRSATGAAPATEASGDLRLDTSGAAFVAGFQLERRKTLDWLPLFAGVDYRNGAETDTNPAGHQPDLLAPQVWVTDPDSSRYFQVEHEGVGIQALRQEWGVALRPRVNHVLALNQSETLKPSAIDAEFDYSTLRATIAFRSEQRLEIDLNVGQVGDGSVLALKIPAELWYLAPGTIVGVDSSGALASAGSSHRVLRNDAGRFAAFAAGAIARYCYPRSRAEIRVKALLPWGNLLGSMLDAVESAGRGYSIRGPVTEITWAVGDRGPETRVRSGYAGS